eukprot:1179836-Prorocentrum_minimum.AAC.1
MPVGTFWRLVVSLLCVVWPHRRVTTRRPRYSETVCQSNSTSKSATSQLRLALSTYTQLA